MRKLLRDSWKIGAMVASFVAIGFASIRLVHSLDDREIMDATTQFIGRDYRELVTKIGKAGLKLETPEDYHRFSLKPSTLGSVYVHSGERGVACVVVDKDGMVRQVLHRGSPP